MSHSWDGELFDHAHVMLHARKLAYTRPHNVSGARGTRRQCLARDERRHETTESQRSVADSSSDRRFVLNADVPQIMRLIINFTESQKKVKDHTQQ